jgi:uncharacterized protein DUF6285
MMDQPSILELVDAVRAFLEQHAMPELKGRTAFHARVAANALGIVSRELKFGARLADEERERLTQLLRQEGTLDELNRELCRRIRDGALGLDTPGLKEHLSALARGKVEVDQPHYSGLRQNAS